MEWEKKREECIKWRVLMHITDVFISVFTAHRLWFHSTNMLMTKMNKLILGWNVVWLDTATAENHDDYRCILWWKGNFFISYFQHRNISHDIIDSAEKKIDCRQRIDESDNVQWEIFIIFAFCFKKEFNWMLKVVFVRIFCVESEIHRKLNSVCSLNR